ncbi:Gfo/Idh/MocA family oxidoreductase [Candidatus Bathyarchaeota archaeon]|nr:Gfo/Idh/MocA family oxidoreductase [Candidatus Bathyarchaeota archaeon]
MGRTLRLGVIGAGSIAEYVHFPSIKSMPDVELEVICDVNEERARNAALKWGAKRWYVNYEHMFRKEKGKLDAVIIASPNAYHRDQALAAADSGVHVIVEKPISCTNREAWEIVDACRRSGIKLMVGCNYRFWIPNELAKELIDAEVIGKPVMGRSALHEGWNLYPESVAFSRFRFDPTQAGAGALFDLGSHKVDLLMWLLGSKPKRVVGKAERLATPESKSKLDDAVIILIEFENGSIAAITLDRFSPVVTEVNEIYGTEGTICTSTESGGPFRSVPLAVYTHKDYTWENCPEILKKYRWPVFFWAEDIISKPMPKRWVSIVPPREWSYTRMLNHFVECLREDKEPRISGEDGAWVMEVLCGVIKSMKTGCWIELPIKEEVTPSGYTPIREYSS